MKKALELAVKACPAFSGKHKEVHNAGTISALAAHLGISRGAVCQWDKVPTERVLQVERITGVSRHDLRPDVFGRPVKVEAVA